MMADYRPLCTPVGLFGGRQKDGGGLSGEKRGAQTRACQGEGHFCFADRMLLVSIICLVRGFVDL